MAVQPLLAEISDWHIIVLALIVVLLFGGKKLPEVARGLGEAMREFKKASRDLQNEPHQTVQQTPPPPAQPAAPPQPVAAIPQNSSEPKHS